VPNTVELEEAHIRAGSERHECIRHIETESAVMARSCIFCGGSKLTREHVIPVWLEIRWRELVGEKGDIFVGTM
jgi:hypothetical protein